MDATNNVKAATISRLMTANVSTVRPGLTYWREASHRPLHGIPADAAFHLPDAALPLSWPFANAPPIETRTIPSRPMLAGAAVRATAAEVRNKAENIVMRLWRMNQIPDLV